MNRANEYDVSARTATDAQLIGLLLLRQSVLSSIGKSHPDIEAITEARNSAQRELLYRMGDNGGIARFVVTPSGLVSDREQKGGAA